MDDIDSMLSDISEIAFGKKYLLSEIFFAVWMNDDKLRAVITPKAYYEENGTLYDGHFRVPEIESFMEETAESVWAPQEGSEQSKLWLEEFRDLLIGMGISEFPDASDIICQMYGGDKSNSEYLDAAILKPEDILFCVRGKNAVLFTPKAFFEENGHLYDDSIQFPKKKEWKLIGATEDIYSYNKEFTKEQFIKELLDAGFQQDPEMEKLVDEGIDPEFFDDCSH